MAIKDALLPEFNHEMATARKVIERVPVEKFGYKPVPSIYGPSADEGSMG